MPEEKHEELKTLFSWKAPLRIFKKRDKKYFTNLSLFVFLICLVLIFLKEFFLVAVIVALLFLTYANATIEPEVLEHKITTQGLSVGGRTYLWEELREFWFVRKGEQALLNVDTVLRFPARLFVVVREGEIEEVKKLLSRYLSFREEPKISWLDRLSEVFSSRLALS
jgi:hypothetical protein